MPVVIPLEGESEEQRRDRDHVMDAVTKDGRALRYAAPALQGDREVVLAATRTVGRHFKWASEALFLFQQ